MVREPAHPAAVGEQPVLDTSDEFGALLASATGQGARRDRDRPSPLALVVWSLAALPTAALGLLLSMAVRVRLDWGAWPVRNQPDPKDLGLHNTITVAAILGSFAAVVVVPLLALAGSVLGRRRAPVWPPVLAVAGFVLLVVVVRGDLGGLGQWIAD